MSTVGLRFEGVLTSCELWIANVKLGLFTTLEGADLILGNW
jgi:hypothetical protein